MNTSIVDEVALWAGLISSIVGIVLSIVAIVFAVLVDRSAREVTAQTIKSLQKIEADVERLSGDTRELIKAGWDKMLGSNYPTSPVQQDDTAAKELAAGIAAELKDELDIGHDKQIPKEIDEKLNGIIERLENAFAVQMREPLSDRTGNLVDYVNQSLASLSPMARAIAYFISTNFYHLTRKQYLALTKGALSEAVTELRKSGVLVPLQGRDEDGKKIPVYFFPPQISKAFRVAISLSQPLPEKALNLVASELKRIGYLTD